MSEPTILRTPVMNRRTFVTALGQGGLLMLLFSRLFYMQFLNQDKYKILSEKNRISLIIKPPIRGEIFDRANQCLAKNKPCFRLLLDKNINPSYMDEVTLLQKILHIKNDDMKEILKKIKQASIKIPIILLDQLDWKEVAAVEENKPYLTSIFVDRSESRLYPYNNHLAHIVGYLGKEERCQAGNILINKQDFNMGKTGVEKYYENYLQGEIGYKQMEVNAYGKYIRTLSEYESKCGENLELTIDSDLQSEIYGYLNKQGASAVVMDVRTGEILIMASSPSFDPNKFSKLSNQYWKELTTSPYKPLINKVISSTYPPGSVFKIVTVLAALEAGMPLNKTVRCTGAPMLGHTHFKCHSSRGHGDISMYNAIKFSCNSYMYEMARKAGGDTIINIARKLGFGSVTGIDLTSESKGFVPSKAWKKEKQKLDWTLADSMNISIGQGFMSSTPLQLVRGIAAIAQGQLITPKVSKMHTSVIQDLDIPLEHLKIVREAMNRAVNSPGGTAYYSHIPDPRKRMAGKTGTSQVFTKGKTSGDSSKVSQWNMRTHAVFGGFAPFHDPKYAVVVLVDHGGGGGRAAAPLASKIMSRVLDKYL